MATDAAKSLTICHVDAERKFSGGEVQVFLLMHGLRAGASFDPDCSRGVSGRLARKARRLRRP